MTKVVCVVRGGTSHESEKSVLYGAKVLRALRDLGHDAKDLYLHPNGTFTLDGTIGQALAGTQSTSSARRPAAAARDDGFRDRKRPAGLGKYRHQHRQDHADKTDCLVCFIHCS